MMAQTLRTHHLNTSIWKKIHKLVINNCSNNNIDWV